MRRAVWSVGPRPRRILRAAAAMLGAITAVLVLGATPAAATWDNLPGRITMDCVVAGEKNTYRAVFGYDNNTRYSGTIPVGRYNFITPKQFDGIQTTNFAPGAHRASFATPPIARGQRVTWTVGWLSVTADANSRKCGPEVQLPAEGNGLAPVLVLAGSVIAALIGIRARRWRLERSV
ncbi:hypothetical protein SAMN05444365_103122 [Micromonospora pattaloongensis]|uniref:Uncharacterized protein n=1 Tax=Micromonospora pattaloongensis TaxID=405436 RepID=A0A1H3LWD3_9ACTN|nr:hypothetical protein [Micromonospora pattaloongensis]SDY68666.1 hypothetical protein SAMN05444365_103122 [Micromonospora pattaloongensis]